MKTSLKTLFFVIALLTFTSCKNESKSFLRKENVTSDENTTLEKAKQICKVFVAIYPSYSVSLLHICTLFLRGSGRRRTMVH